MFSTLNKTLTLSLDSDSAVPEAVKWRARNSEAAAETDVHEIEIPSVIELCSTCSGRGKNSLHLGAFSGRRLEEARADEEFWDDYTSGRFDRNCETCEGHGRINVPDTQRCSAELLAAINEEDEDESYCRAEQRAEYMMSGGWREEGWFEH